MGTLASHSLLRPFQISACPVISPLRIAAVGLEHDEIYRVLDRLRQHNAAELVAIAERSGRLRMAAAGRYRVPVFPRLTPLLAETAVDAVLVATANGDKAAAIQEALRAGKHVIAHAPLAVSVEQFDAVAQVQAASGTALLSLQPLRFMPAYARLRELIAAGQLGAVNQAVVINSQQIAATPRTQAFFATKTHGGVLTNLAVHDLDALRWFGGDVAVEYAATRCIGVSEHPDFEDSGIVRCGFAGGGEGVVICNWLAPEASAPFRELTVIGTAGTAWISGSKLQVWGGAMPEALPAGGVFAYGELGRTLSPAAAGDAAVDAFAAMVDGALATFGDTAARHAATADALNTMRAAVQAQHMAWQERM